MAQKRENWGSKVGLILAMAGNAIGLGNFLRFPVQATQNGGGTFMIPYLFAFILLGIPMVWIEWSIGRHGGKYGHGSMPGMLDVLWKSKVAKYLGMFAIFTSTVIIIYYTYIESWSLAFSFFSITKSYFGLESFNMMHSFLTSYQGENTQYFANIWPAYIFMLITFLINFFVLRKGVSKGIEKLALIAMPLLFIFAIVIVIRIFTIGTPDPVNHPDWNVMKGLAFIWEPDFSMLGNAKIWLAAAGQIFFTLSVGMGTLSAYASYLKEKDDIALGAISASFLNEFAEVILGGTIAIPVAVAFFGITTTQDIALGGAFNLGFVSMPIIFQNMPYGEIFGFLWFLMLFLAGITSSVAMAQPIISFLEEQFGLSKNKATAIVGALIFIGINLVVVFFQYGFLDEMDYWSGTFALVIVALIEVIIYAWIFGMDKGWKEINMGAEIKIPKIFYYVIKYITPFYLLAILISWTIQDAIPIFLMQNIPAEEIPYRWMSRGLMILIAIGILFLIHFAWKRNEGKDTFKLDYDEDKGEIK
ncbi:sodium-dependent transporter [bacterium]|nr:sodium-dependent transporter [bacterium]